MLVLFMLYPTCNRFTFTEYLYRKISYHCHCMYRTHMSIMPTSHGSLDMILGQCVVFMVDSVALEEVPLRVFQFLLISMIQQMLHFHSFLCSTVVLVYHTVSSMPWWRRQLLWAVVMCVHACQLPLQLNQPFKTVFGYNLGYVWYSQWYPFKIDQPFETDLGYCQGCHRVTVGGT